MDFKEILLDSLIDTAKLLPLLVLVYFLIELLEYKNIFKFEKSKLLKSKCGVAIGALFGSLPQCGFSVISSDLYSKRKISVGVLIDVYIATSDEAIPIMIANYHYIPSMLILIFTKIIMAISIGYLTSLIYTKFILKKSKETKQNSEEDENHEHEHLHACCNHDLETNKFNFFHPFIHCLKITLYIFIINIAIGTIVELIGEEQISEFLLQSTPFQPLFALLIGLIPNCASSVVLTNLFTKGLISFGSVITGLSVNAGLGLILLFKENKNRKENIFILTMLIIPSLIFGYILHILPIKI